MKLIVLTAPSGAGKTTIARRVMDQVPGLRFSISATTRAPREGEQHGVDYFFLTEEEFEAQIAADAFIEYEEVYPGRYYGTLRHELERLAESTAVVLDVDVKGAINVKRLYGEQALTLFIAPPSLDALAERLHTRGTETEQRIAVRLSRATLELDYAHEFDAVIVNDDLETAVSETIARVQAFLRG